MTEVPTRRRKLCAGAGFALCLAGPITTMPACSLPAYRHIDINDDGDIVGLS